MTETNLAVFKFDKNIDLNEENRIAYDNEIWEKCLEKNFGIIKLYANANDKVEIPLHLILTIDVSSSMEEEYGWNNKIYSKLNYVKATLKSIFKYLKNDYKDRFILLSLISFSDSADVIESYIEINKKDINYLNDLVDRLEAVGCTNIYDALKKATILYEEFEIYLNSNSDVKEKYYTRENFKHVNILLTDGEITVGINNPKALAEIAEHKLIELQLLGYGEEHDIKLLKTLENLTDGEYRFVDSFEAAGAVYGDVLSGILHPAWKDISIQIENGLIYNYKQNKWSKYLHIPRIGDKCEKVLSCKLFKNPKISITFKDNTDQIHTIISNVEENKIISEDSEDLRCYWIRQLTIELMNEIQQFREENNTHESKKIIQNRLINTPMRNKNIKGNPYVPKNIMTGKAHENKLNKLKENLENIIVYIDKYILENARELKNKNIELLNDLKDDLNICKKSIISFNNIDDIYLNSRLSSQGAQRAYNTYLSLDNYNIVEPGMNTEISNTRQKARVSCHASPYAQRVINQVAQYSQEIISSIDSDSNNNMDIDDN